MERAQPGGGKTTGNECLPLLSTDKECRLNSEHWCLTGQVLSSILAHLAA